MAGNVGERRMLIDGKLVDSSNGNTFDNINPATEEILGPVADGTKDDMNRAIDAARRAFDETDWSTDKELRKRVLQQMHDALVEEKEELREELINEVGCPRTVTYMAQLDWPLEDGILYPRRMIDEFEWDRNMGVHESAMGKAQRFVWKEAMGVVGSIVPWNYPFEVTINKVAQVLATGNTTILKPAPDTPWNATRLGRIVAEKTDMPAGVFNVVTSSDHMVGEELTLSPKVDQISFTGSTRVGKRIMELGASTLKRVFLELGGKSAAMVMDDVDIEALLPMLAFGACVHGGQGCAMQTRALIPKQHYKRAIEILEAAFQTFPYGDPQGMDVMMGPQVSKLQRERILGYIEKGKAEGARLIAGGGRPEKFPKGWYVEPTLFADVSNTMTIAREEIFGPVLALIPYDNEEHAIQIANDSIYGLSGGVYTADQERGIRIARRIRTGSFSVNGGGWYGADMPYGGYKDSGIGRQNGIEGFNQYLETKIVAWPVA